MEQEKIKLLHSIISERWQFPEHHEGKLSELHKDIMEVLKCSETEAIKDAATFCNFTSFYATTFSTGYHSLAFTEVFEKLLNTYLGKIDGVDRNYTDTHGYLWATKNQIADLIGWQSEKPIYYYNVEILRTLNGLDPEKFYQIKIKGDTHGFHFMATYIDNGKLYIDDTSYRGIGVETLKYINKNNFVWISEV